MARFYHLPLLHKKTFLGSKDAISPTREFADEARIYRLQKGVSSIKRFEFHPHVVCKTFGCLQIGL
jgi:hypothetical protein